MDVRTKVLGISSHCKRCNRKLKSDESRNLGFGSTCKKKYDEEQSLLQMEIYEFLEGDIDASD